MKKILLICLLALPAFAERLVWRGEDPYWNQFDNAYYGWVFRFHTNGTYTFFYHPTDSAQFQTNAQFHMTGRFTRKSIVNYRKSTVSLCVGEDERGRERYITIRRDRIIGIWD